MSENVQQLNQNELEKVAGGLDQYGVCPKNLTEASAENCIGCEYARVMRCYADKCVYKCMMGISEEWEGALPELG